MTVEALARELESALESHFGKLAATAPPEIRPILAEIAADTARHQHEIDGALAAEKQRKQGGSVGIRG